MVPSRFAYWVRTSFVSWVQKFEDDGDCKSLDRFIMKWLEQDNFAMTGGDYTRLLQIVLILIHEYENDPSIIDYAGSEKEGTPHPRKRRVQRVLQLEEPLWPEIRLFDQGLFDEAIYRNMLKKK